MIRADDGRSNACWSPAELVAFVATSDVPRARAFYEQVLGLTLVGDDGFALVFDAHGTTLRVTRSPRSRSRRTRRWAGPVPDIATTVGDLVERGVELRPLRRGRPGRAGCLGPRRVAIGWRGSRTPTATRCRDPARQPAWLRRGRGRQAWAHQPTSDAAAVRKSRRWRAVGGGGVEARERVLHEVRVVLHRRPRRELADELGVRRRRAGATPAARRSPAGRRGLRPTAGRGRRAVNTGVERVARRARCGSRRRTWRRPRARCRVDGVPGARPSTACGMVRQWLQP